MATNEDFLWTVFNPGEVTAGGDTEQVMSLNYGLKGIFPVEELLVRNSAKFCINPLRPGVKDRSDANLATRRSFLVEIDMDAEGEKMTETQQSEYIDGLQLPWSTRVWTGGKSLHHLVVLNQDISQMDFLALRDRIYGKVRGGTGAVPLADFNARLQCQIARWPGHVRADGRVQILREVRRRVSFEELNLWLTQRGFPYITPSPEPSFHFSQKYDPDSINLGKPLSAATESILAEGSVPGDNNSRMTRAAMGMVAKQWGQQFIFDRLRQTFTSQTNREIWASIRGAIRKATRDD